MCYFICLIEFVCYFMFGVEFVCVLFQKFD